MEEADPSGQAWDLVDDDQGEMTGILVVPTVSRHQALRNLGEMELLIGTAGGIFGVDDERISDRTPISHIARHDDGWWAVGDDGMFRDGDLMADAPAGATLNCVLPTEHTVWVGGSSARLFFLDGDSLVEEKDFRLTPGRDRWHTPWGGPPDVRSMSEGPDGLVYINVHVGGILRFDNTGFTPTIDIAADVHQVVAHPDRPETAVAATAYGLAVTRNGHDFDIRSAGLSHSYCRAVAIAGDLVLISSSRGPRGGNALLHRGNLDDGYLEPCPGLPTFDGNIDTHCVAVTDTTWYFGQGSQVWVSTDTGATWEVAIGGLPAIRSLA